jgi:hypothetical protein
MSTKNSMVKIAINYFSSCQDFILYSYNNSLIEDKNVYIGPNPEKENSRKRRQ